MLLVNLSEIFYRENCQPLSEIPTLGDWADHLTTIFRSAGKKFIEMRGADGGLWRRLCALPAFWVGLCYNQSSLDAAWDLVKKWNSDTREACA